MFRTFRVSAIIFASLFSFATPRVAQAQLTCATFCNPYAPCDYACYYNYNYQSNCMQYNGVCNRDPDGDGIDWAVDNCPKVANINQADCDGDRVGDACDMNGTFVPSGKKIACASDKDQHLPLLYVTYEMKYQQKYVDVSSCHSPDRWNHSTLSNNCYGYCNDLDANACASVCRNDNQYQCSISLCMPVGQGTCNPDTIP
jgi:hypothetical protein